MKTLFLLLFVYICHITVAEDIEHDRLQKHPVAPRMYPKKAASYISKKPKMLHRRFNNKKTFSGKMIQHEKDALPKSDYTVFPPQDNRRLVDIPNSPYFPLDINDEPKARVKKVLPEYAGTIRKKRAAEGGTEAPAAAPVAAAAPAVPAPAGAALVVPAPVAAPAVGVSPSAAAPEPAKPISRQGDVPGAAPADTAPAAAPADATAAPATTKPPPAVTKPPATTAKAPAKKIDTKATKRLANKPSKHPKKTKRRSKSKRRAKVSKTKRGKISGKASKLNSKSKSKKAKRIGNKRKLRSGFRSRPGDLRRYGIGQSSPNRFRKAERRLIAGRDGMIETYPYVVSIQKGDEHWCAGAILNPRLIITTANCLWKSSRMSRMRVRACSRHTDRGGQLLRIQEVMKHPAWSIRKNPDNDVALFLVDKNIKFTDACHGVDLPNRVMMPAFEDAWVTSWGADRRDGIFERRPMSLQVYHGRLIDREKCNNATMRFGVGVSENFICLAQTGKRAPCTRDTGAPAVSDGVLWGLASWGLRKLCGTERFPAMFSYIASHSNMDFIINATTSLMSEERHYPFLDRYHEVEDTNMEMAMADD